jgi:hypothetical protein
MATTTGTSVHVCACTRYTWPILWETDTGKPYEPKKVEPLLVQARAYGFRVQTAAMDKGYDYRLVYQVCQALHVRPIIPPNRRGKSRDLHRVPECLHGRWVFAGGDASIAASKWRCPAGLCSPASV